MTMTAKHPEGEVRQPDALRAEEKVLKILDIGNFPEYASNRDYIQAIKGKCGLEQKFEILPVFEKIFENKRRGVDAFMDLTPHEIGLIHERML